MKRFHDCFVGRCARLIVLVIPLTLAGVAASQTPQGSAFTYQGALKISGAPYTGTADLTFALFDDAGGDFQVGSTLAINAVNVVDGTFTASLDFGSLAFNGDQRWLEIKVHTPSNGGLGPFTTLTPRQLITAAPYALYALNVANPSPFVASGSNAVFTGGNVGIGTSSPTQPLHITNGLFATMLLDRTGGAQVSASAQGSIGSIGTTNAFPFRFNTNNTVRMTIDTSGNVGIGTTTPDGRLDVRQSAAADILNLYDGGANVLTVIDGGNVGINAATPTQRLQVAGNIALSGWVGTDAIDPFEIFVNNQRGMRFEAASTSPPNGFGPMPNIIGGYSGNEVRPREVDSTPLVAGAFIGGGGYAGFENRVTDHFGVVAGGAGNMAGLDAFSPGNSPYATVGGGYQNRAKDQASTVAGGWQNKADAKNAFVGGGESNHADADSSAIVGGNLNNTVQMYAFIGGGQSNLASGMWSSVLGGQANSASGLSATIAGGTSNAASGQYSFAAGRRAKAIHNGAFVWADSTNADFASTATNQFLIRAGGGVGINTNAPSATLHVAGDAIFNSGLKPGNTASSMTIASASITAPATFSLQAGSAMAITGNSTVDVTSDSNLTVDSATTLRLEGTTVNVVSNANATMTASGTLTLSAAQVAITGISSLGIGGSSGGFMLGVNGSAAKPGGGSWSALSDARLKKNIQPLHDSLERLLALRGVSFEYRDPTMPLCDDQVHDGFIAQEVERVFPQWVSDRADGYKTLSISGFEALTVEALRQLRDEKDAQIESLQRENDELRARLEAIEKLIHAMVRSDR